MAKVLTFLMSGDVFGVPIAPVREIIGLGEVTPVPLMPGFVCGVMNLRGNVVPVLDLGRRLGLDKACVSERSCILLMDCSSPDGDTLMGLQVDAVQEVLRVEDDMLATVPTFGTRVGPEYIGGMVPGDSGATILLAIERVLAMPELEQLVDNARSGVAMASQGRPLFASGV
jgi:purine-binding chemotaxis protein CheW